MTRLRQCRSVRFWGVTPCATAAQQGWDKLRNGDLLTEAEKAGFQILVTTDKNMRNQQNMAKRKIAVVVLGKQQWPELRPHVHLVAEAVKAATPGGYSEVGIPFG